MPPDQPTDAGKDRETIKRILRERYEDLAFSPGDAYTRVVDAIAQALAAARAEADRDWRQALWLGHGHLGLYGDDGEMQCAKCRPMWDYKRGSIFDTVHAALCAARAEGARQERKRIAQQLHDRGWWAMAHRVKAGTDGEPREEPSS